MAMLWSFLGNDPKRVACLLHPLRAQLRDTTQPRAFRLGYYNGDDVLMHRAPLDGGEPFELMRATARLHSDALVTATTESVDDDGAVGRFRNWLFGFCGGIELSDDERARLRASLPLPLERSLTQGSPAQLLFHHVLATLGLPRLEEKSIQPQQLLAIISETLVQLGRTLSSDRLAQARFALTLTNGRVLVAVRHGVPLSYQRLAVGDCAVCAQRDSTVSTKKRTAEHEHLRAILVAAGDATPALTTSIGDATALLVAPDLSPSERPLFR